MSLRRAFTVGTTVLTLTALSAGPALAHYCYKSGWNEMARAGASNSQAWMTADGWYDIIEGVRAMTDDEDCDDALDAFAAHIGTFGDDTLFMGPGLLAGGAVRKGKTPGKSQIGHMDTSLFGPIFTHCFGDEGPGH